MLRNLSYAGVSAGSAVLLLLLFVLAGRTLGEIEFGKFSFALALGTIFETLMDFGLHQATIRAVARDHSRASELLEHTLAIKLIWSAVALIALVTTATWLRPEPDVRLACYLIGTALVFRSYLLTIRGVLQGLERFGWDCLVVLGDRVLLLGFGWAALATGSGLRCLAMAFVLGRGVALGLSAWMVRAQLGHLGIRFDWAIWRQLQTTALPLGFFLVVANIYAYVDSVLLGVMRTDLETGQYAAAYRVYEGLSYAPAAISAVLTPRLSGLFLSDRAAHRRVVSLGLAGALALAALVAAVAYTFAPQLMTALFGPTFAPAAAPFRILCYGFGFVATMWVLYAVALSVGRERLLLRTALIGLAVNVGLNVLLIPSMGASGAAWATVAGEMVSVVVLGAGLWRTE
jgi:O-antigen/teichoic acid export membrane protein